MQHNKKIIFEVGSCLMKFANNPSLQEGSIEFIDGLLKLKKTIPSREHDIRNHILDFLGIETFLGKPERLILTNEAKST
jgi:hypothetical protein